MARRRSAYTFIELTIVVLILGIMAAVAVPRYVSSLEYFRIEAAARKIAADLEVAQRTAVSKGTNCTVQFSVSLNKYTLVGINDPDHPSSAFVTQLSKTSYPATLVSAAFNSVSDLTYDLYGRPMAGAVLKPLTSGVIQIQSGGSRRTITINATTGKAKISS